MPEVMCRYVGNKPSPHRRKALQRLHPAGLTDDWGDKLAGREFFSHNLKATFEHYLQARAGQKCCVQELALVKHACL